MENKKIIRSGMFINFEWFIVKNNKQIEWYIRIPLNNKLYYNQGIVELTDKNMKWQEGFECNYIKKTGIFLNKQIDKVINIRVIEQDIFRMCMELVSFRQLKTTVFEELLMKLVGFTRIDRIKIKDYFSHPRKEKLLEKIKFWSKYNIQPEILVDKNNYLIDGFCYYYIAQMEEFDYIKTKKISKY